MKKERKKESGWPIEDDELDNVSGGMRGLTASNPCPKCIVNELNNGVLN